jgi:hypothetical protein
MTPVREARLARLTYIQASPQETPALYEIKDGNGIQAPSELLLVILSEPFAIFFVPVRSPPPCRGQTILQARPARTECGEYGVGVVEVAVGGALKEYSRSLAVAPGGSGVSRTFVSARTV